MSEKKCASILEDFKSKEKIFNSLSKSLKQLVPSFFYEQNIDIHNISSRVKDYTSLKKKILKKDSYSCISDITDIVGIRIICYFEHDIKKIVEVLKGQFEVKEEIDKKNNLEVNSFGYLSYHLICQFKKDRETLIEYKNFCGIKFEIQVRTILQHAWAEIEHDIGYKSKNDVPKTLKRDFSQIASFLEVADEKFSKIKINQNKNIEKFKKEPKSILTEEVNKDTLSHYISNNCKILVNINCKLKENNKLKINEKIKEDEIDSYVDMLIFYNIENINELDKKLEAKEDDIYNVMSKYEKLKNYDSLYYTLPLLYLFYIIGIEKNNIHEFMEKFNIGTYQERDSFIELIESLL